MKFGMQLAAFSLLGMLGCGGKERPPEAPSAPVEGATSEQIGAPRDTHYAADIEANRGRVRVVVREESTCDVIPVQSVIENGKKKFIAGDPTSSQPCNQRVARNVSAAQHWIVLAGLVGLALYLALRALASRIGLGTSAPVTGEAPPPGAAASPPNPPPRPDPRP